MVCVRNVRSLKTAHARRRVQRAEPRVFAKTFRDASPARVAREVNHRRKNPVNSRRRGFAGRNFLRLLEEFGVERARLRQRNWERCPKPVDGIVPKNRRNPQAALLDGDMLQFVPHHGRFNQACPAQKRTHPAAPQVVRHRHIRVIAHVRLPKLADFFFKRHLPEQIGDAFFNRLRRVFINVLFPVFIQVNPASVINRSRIRRHRGERKQQTYDDP